MTFSDVIKAVTAERSGYAAAKKLGIYPQTFYRYANGQKLPSDEVLDKMIEMTGLDPMEVYLAVYAERIHNPLVAEQFRNFAA